MTSRVYPVCLDADGRRGPRPVVTRREAWLTALAVFAIALVVRVVAASQIELSRSPRTPRTTSASRATSSRAGGSSRTRCGATARRRSSSRGRRSRSGCRCRRCWPRSRWRSRPASAPIPLETAMRAAQVVSVLAGALVAVLAWRLAADVAAERGLPVGRARTLAIGRRPRRRGLPAAAPALGPARLHDAVRRARPRREPAHDARAPRSARRATARPAAARDRPAPRARSPHPQRGGLARDRRGHGWPGALRGETRAVRARMIGVVAVVSLVVFAPWAARDWAVFGNPLPGSGALQRAVGHRLRHLRLERPADARPLPRRWRRRAGRDADRRASATTSSTSCCSSASRCPSSGSSRCRGRAGTARSGRSSSSRVLTFLVTSLLFPVATTWGTFLHAAAPVARAAPPLRPRCARRRASRARPPPGLDAAGRVARPAARVFGSALFSVALLPAFGAARGDRAHLRRARAPDGGDRRPARRQQRRSSTTSRSGSPRRRACPTLALPDEPPADILDLATHFGARWLVVVRPSTAAGPRSSTAPTPTRPASRRSCCRSPTTRRTPMRSSDIRVFRIACAGVARAAARAASGDPSP